MVLVCLILHIYNRPKLIAVKINTERNLSQSILTDRNI